MGRKNSPPADTGSPNPFKVLKGFAVCADPPPRLAETPGGTSAIVPSAPSPAVPRLAEPQGDEPSFAEEMRRLGVHPVARPEPLTAEHSSPPAGEAETPSGPPQTEEQLFLASLGGM